MYSEEKRNHMSQEEKLGMNYAQYHNAVVEFLNHLEDVLDDKNFEAIDTELWNLISLGK